MRSHPRRGHSFVSGPGPAVVFERTNAATGRSVGAASGARDDPKMEIKGMYIVCVTASNNPGQALKKCFDPVVLWAERARFVLRGTARN